MFKVLMATFWGALLFAIAGCAATVGRDFVRPSSDTFKLGETTYSQVVTQIGDPRSVSDIIKNEKNMTRIIYNYGVSNGEPLEEGVLPVRQMVYIFHNNILVSQAFLSSFKSDNSNFDDKKIGGILKGITNRSDVIQLLGKPTASFVPPILKEPAIEAIGYGYITTRRGERPGSSEHSTKILTISFDDRGFVLDIEYESSGNK